MFGSGAEEAVVVRLLLRGRQRHAAGHGPDVEQSAPPRDPERRAERREGRGGVSRGGGGGRRFGEVALETSWGLNEAWRESREMSFLLPNN